MRHFTSNGTDQCSKRFIKPPFSISRATSIDSDCCRLPTCVCVCVCVFIKLHITTQSGPVILVILCHSH